MHSTDPHQHNSDLLTKIRKALDLEERAQFVNFQGRKQDFATFMRESLREISRHFADNCLQQLSRNYSFYEQSDHINRVKLVRQTRAELEELQREGEELAFDNDDRELQAVGLDELNINKLQVSALNRLKLQTIEDLLRYFPSEHIDFSQRLLIRDLRVGQQVTVVGMIEQIRSFPSPKNNKLQIMNITLKDETGRLSLSRFFSGKSAAFLANQYRKQLPKDSLAIASGTVEFARGSGNRYQLKDFSLEVLESTASQSTGQLSQTGRIIPIYKLTEGISQLQLRRLILKVLNQYSKQIQESIPSDITKSHGLVSLATAFQEIHFPSSKDNLQQAERRLAFEEFLLIQLALNLKNQSSQTRTHKAIQTPLLEKLLKEILPFSLTQAQQRVWHEIQNDLQSERSLNRLIQGDVGSGKTVIALLAMLWAVERGEQAVLMAPTEILAQQHFSKFQIWLSQLGIKIALLIGSQRASVKREILTDLSNGQIKIIIGTHALIQQGVEFAELGMMVIDEQHRFGVRQREELKSKGAFDCLFMTATPIPRTLAIALYGDLDLSEIDELPPGRQPILTKLVSGRERKKMQSFVQRELQKGRQAYIVYPLIEESETLSAKSVTEEADKLALIYEGYQLAMLHGKLSSVEKDRVMEDFRQGKIDILISTTVIEVGVDVPNATIMIIEDAERFGLSQLHQLRGRIGRGKEKSYCFLLGELDSERLRVMEETENGFLIARRDFELRGPGELIGTKQSGLSDFAQKCLVSHSKELEKARQSALQIIREDPALKNLSPVMQQRLKLIRELISLVESG